MTTLIAHDFTVQVQLSVPEQLDYLVRGMVTCPSDGWSLMLEPDNEGINPDPTLAVLRLDAFPPEVGPPVMEEEQVEYAGSDDPALETIEIRLGEDIETPEGGKVILLSTVVRTY